MVRDFDRITEDIVGGLLGPPLAIALFLLLVLYTIALLGTTSRARIPGLGWLKRHSLYGDLVLGLGLLATIPAVAVALVLTSRSSSQEAEHTMQLLNESTAGIAARLELFLENQMTAIESLADSIHRAGRFDRTSLSEWLESHHAMNPDYLTMLIAGAQGDIITTTTLVHGKVERLEAISHNIRDRRYFIEPMRNGKTFASDVFQGRKLGKDPIIAISTRLHGRDGHAWGIVEGSLNLETLSRFSPAGQTPGLVTKLLILDQDNRVVFSSHPDYKMLQSVDPEHIPPDDANIFIAQAESFMGWQVIGTVDATPIKSQFRANARVALLWLFAAVLTALMLSAAIARRFRRPLAALNDAVRTLELEGAEADIKPPLGTPREIEEVFGFLNSLSRRLNNSYRQLTAAMEAGKHYREQLESTLARREGEIQSRTRELEHSNRSLRTLSHVDQLTGLANRRRFTETADQLWRHGRREQSLIAMIIMDIDYFKDFNDTYGHQAGDQCLSDVGLALSECALRPLDFVARYGGEEFIMIIAESSLVDTLAIAERVRKTIENLGIPHSASPHNSIVTMSLGVAVDKPAPDSHYDTLLQAADQALYHAKAMGRNCVAYMVDEKVAVYRDEQSVTARKTDQDILKFPGH